VQSPIDTIAKLENGITPIMRKSFYVCYVSLNELSRFPVILLGAKLFFYAIIWLYAINYLNTHLPTSLEKVFLHA
jgi:hypothetical protein